MTSLQQIAWQQTVCLGIYRFGPPVSLIGLFCGPASASTLAGQATNLAYICALSYNVLGGQ